MQQDGVVFGDFNFASCSQNGLVAVFEGDSNLFGDHGAAGENGEVVEDGLPVVPKAGGLDSSDVDAALDPIQDEVGQRFALDVFCDDEQRAFLLDGVLEVFEYLVEVADFVL